MLKNIKSSYFIKIIFSYTIEKRKLNLIKYNNVIKNILEIDIINYRFFSGKYIIYEKKRFGKEYNAYNDQLLYEGKYLKGKRNGKGKEYYFGRLIFEGEYLNGERNGKGKEYYSDNRIKYEGNFIKGKKWNGKEYDFSEKNKVYKLNKGNGFIKEYDHYGELIFEGNYLKGERNGKGKKYFNYNIIFEGEYLNGEKNGKGKSYYRYGGLKFEGEYLNGKK